MGLKTKDIMTSFGAKIQVHELSMMDKMDTIWQKDISSMEICVNAEHRAILRDNPGTKEDINAIVEAIIEVNGWGNKPVSVLDPKPEPQKQ